MPHLDGVNDGVGYGVKGVNTTPTSLGHFHEAGVVGTSQGGVGVFGTSGDISSFHIFGSADIGVQGVSPAGTGVSAISGTGHGVSAASDLGDGVLGVGKNGVHGRSSSTTDSGVLGENTSAGGTGVLGLSSDQGTQGFLAGRNPIDTNQSVGVFGKSDQLGVFGFANTAQGIGVAGNSANGAGIGVQGHTSTNVGVLGSSEGPGLAGKFIGDVEMTGSLAVTSNIRLSGRFVGDILMAGSLAVDHDIQVAGNINGQATTSITCFDVRLIGGDCAEEFDLADGEGVSPGTVMVIDTEGTLRPSREAYDRKVAGVASGAGECKPGIVLNKQKSQGNRVPLTLVGRVYCNVDAAYSPVEVGDLLTTSPTPGHAMKADNPLRAFGAVLGKALRPLTAGRGLVPILVALQ